MLCFLSLKYGNGNSSLEQPDSISWWFIRPLGPFGLVKHEVKPRPLSYVISHGELDPTLYFNAFTVQRPKHILVGYFYYSAAFLLFARATISSFQKLGTCPFFSPRNWACVGTTKFPTKTSLMLFLTLGLIVLFQCNNSAQEILYIEAALCSPHVTVPHAPAWTILLSLITAKCTFQITSASFHQG